MLKFTQIFEQTVSGKMEVQIYFNEMGNLSLDGETLTACEEMFSSERQSNDPFRLELLIRTIGELSVVKKKHIPLIFRYLQFIRNSPYKNKFVLIEELIPILQQTRIDYEYNNFTQQLCDLFWLDYDEDVYDIGRKIIYVLEQIGSREAYDCLKKIAESERRGNFEARELIKGH